MSNSTNFDRSKTLAREPVFCISIGVACLGGNVGGRMESAECNDEYIYIANILYKI